MSAPAAPAPAPGAPDGVLAEVTDVVGTAENGGTAVETEPAKLNSVLGASKAEGEVPVDPSSDAMWWAQSRPRWRSSSRRTRVRRSSGDRVRSNGRRESRAARARAR